MRYNFGKVRWKNKLDKSPLHSSFAGGQKRFSSFKWFALIAIFAGQIERERGRLAAQ